MAAIIAITNQKGGVGKTTTASALMDGLCQRGARVLGVDLDPQGNLGFTLGLDIGDGYTVYDVLKGNCAIEQAIAHTEYGDILSSGILLNKYNPRLTLSRDILDLAEQVAEQLHSQVFPVKIRRSVSVAMAPAYGQSVLSYKPDATSARDLQKIVSAVAGDRFPRRKKR